MTCPTPVVIVGGGPAGAVAALALARAHIPCTVLERNAQSSAKVCGEFLSPEAVTLLGRLGFPWRDAEAVTLNQLCVRSGNKEMTAPLPFAPAARSVARPFLDSWLLHQAESQGARVERGVAVHHIKPTANTFDLQTSSGPLVANTVILATGKHAIRGFHTRVPPKAQNLVGYKMNFENLPEPLCERLRDTLFLFFFAGGYGGIARIGTRTATVSLLVQGQDARLQGCKDLALLKSLAIRVPLLQQLLDGAKPAWPRPLTVANLPYGHCDPNTPTHPGLFAVGDQFAVLPSFTGTGLSFALASGSMAANSLIEMAPKAAAHTYARAAHATATSIMTRAMWLHRSLQRPVFAKAALLALTMAPRLAAVVARSTRLPQTPLSHVQPVCLQESHG